MYRKNFLLKEALLGMNYQQFVDTISVDESLRLQGFIDTISVNESLRCKPWRTQFKTCLFGFSKNPLSFFWPAFGERWSRLSGFARGASLRPTSREGRDRASCSFAALGRTPHVLTSTRFLPVSVAYPCLPAKPDKHADRALCSLPLAALQG